MVNTSLSKYVIKSEDFDTTNLDMQYTRVTFYRQFNTVICEFLLVPVTFTNTADHTVIFNGKIPSAFRPSATFKQSVNSYTGSTVRHGLLTINTDGGMKLAMGTANTSMAIYGSVMYPAKVIDPNDEIYFFIVSVPDMVGKGESYTVSVFVKNREDSPLSKTVSLKSNGSLIGSFQTDEDGVASTTVTGTGGGLIRYVAECEQSISEMEIFDYLFYDRGIDGFKNTNWTNYSNRLTVVTDENGTTLTSNGSANGYYFVNGDNPFIFTEYTVEFDVVTSGGTIRWYHQNQNSENENVFTLNSYITDGCHVKIIVQNGTATLYVDNVQKTTATLTVTGPYEISFRTLNAITNTITYKNFTAHPLEGVVIPELTLSSNKNSIVVGETAILTATLTNDDVPVSGATVTFKNNNMTLGAAITDSNGIATYTYTGTGAGLMSITANYEGVTSNVVQLNDGKLTPTLTVEATPSTATLGTSIIFSGQINTAADVSIKLYDGSTLLDTVTTSSGVFSKTVTGLTVGEHTLKAVFEGNESYNTVQSSVLVTINPEPTPEPTPTSITLTGDKSVLSYYDSESATLSATVLDEDSQVMEGVTVEFFNGSTSLGTATTNASGIATKSYSSTGVGDVSFTAECGILVSETYIVTDAVYANANEISQSGSSGDHFTVIDNNLSLTLPSKFEWTFKMKSTSTGSRFMIVPTANKGNSNPNYSIGCQQVSTTRVGLYRTTSVTAVGSDTSCTGTEYHEWKIVRDGNTFKWYFDNVQINSDITLTWFDTYTPKTLGFMYWRTGTMNVKDIVIKVL